MSAIDKLKAAQAANGVAPAITPDALFGTPATTAPAALVVENILNTSAGDGPTPSSELSTLVVENVLDMFSGRGTQTTSLSTMADEIDDGGVKHDLPFATLKKGNWTAYKKNPPEIQEYMPAGDREFRAIYVGIRLGLVAWAGASSATGNNGTPLWSAAVPTPVGHKGSAEMFKTAMRIANKVQYTKRAARVKFDSVGRVSPELHILFWRPDIGFYLAVISSYNSVDATLEEWKSVEGKMGCPMTVKIGTRVEKNPKAVKEEEKEFTTYSLKAEPAVDTRGAEYLQQWSAMLRDDERRKLVAQTVRKFHQGTDFAGLNPEQLVAKLNQYATIN